MKTAKKQSATITNWAFSWDPRAKLMAGFCYIFGVISLTSIPVTILAYSLSIIVLIFMRISIRLLLTRYLIITPFLLLMTVPFLWNPGEDNLIFAGLIILKAFTSMTVITIILESESLDELMNSLAGLKIPTVLITIIILSYRYVYQFLDDLERMLTAVKSRFFRGSIRLKNLNVYGKLMAALLIRALDRSDKMYQAMASRGFNGAFPVERMEKIGLNDIFKTSFVILIIVIFIVIERGFFS